MLILKIGGGAEIDLEAVASDLAVVGKQAVVVVGANAVRDRLARQLDVPVRRVTSLKGYTSVLTDDEAVDLIMMAYAGLRGKRMVELLQQKGMDAVGLSGLDGRLIRARRNKGIRTRRNEKNIMLHDLSGKPVSLNKELLLFLVDGGYTPVITIPVLDEKGFAVNTENDEIVALLHETLHADRIVHLIEAGGLLRDPKDPSSLVPFLKASELADWEERSEGRMKRKIRAIGKLFEHASPVVHVADGRVGRPLQRALSGGGTEIR